MADVVEEYAEAALPAALRPYVASLTGYRLSGFAPGTHVGMPSRHLTLILALDDGITLSGNTLGSTRVRFDAVVAGLHTGPARVHHEGEQRGIQLALTPLGARALLGAPAAAFAGDAVSLDDAMGSVGRRLRERVGATTSWPDRFAHVTAGLSEMLDPDARVERSMAAAWGLLTSRHGQISVEDVAREVGWSRRHLSSRFAREFGPSPKALARVLRFERSRALVGRMPLSDIAIRCGYADQSHLVRDWRQFAGASPTQWLRDDALARV